MNNRQETPYKMVDAVARLEFARRLWAAQIELLRIATDLDAAQAGDDDLARTLGDTGEYFLPTAADFCLIARGLALRLDRCISQPGEQP